MPFDGKIRNKLMMEHGFKDGKEQGKWDFTVSDEG